jgi:hypothetical protein
MVGLFSAGRHSVKGFYASWHHEMFISEFSNGFRSNAGMPKLLWRKDAVPLDHRIIESHETVGLLLHQRFRPRLMMPGPEIIAGRTWKNFEFFSALSEETTNL